MVVFVSGIRMGSSTAAAAIEAVSVAGVVARGSASCNKETEAEASASASTGSSIISTISFPLLLATEASSSRVADEDY